MSILYTCHCLREHGGLQAKCFNYHTCLEEYEKVMAPKEKELAKDPSRGVLNERGPTHGDFEENGKIMQSLKSVMHAHVGWNKLMPYQREALEMIQHKIGRILCGDCNYFDHWRDIAGYAKLVEERCPKPTDTLR